MKPVFCFLVPADRLSSSRTSWQRSMHWSQMKTPGPATSLRTWSCPLPQKLQRVSRRRFSFSFIGSYLYPLRRGRRRGIMAPQDLIGKADALAADEHARPRYEPHPTLTLSLAAEGALRLVPFDLAALALPAKDHGVAATFSFSFSFSFSLSLSAGLIGGRMMPSISPYPFAASEVTQESRSVSCVTLPIFSPVWGARILLTFCRVRRISMAWLWMSEAGPC